MKTGHGWAIANNGEIIVETVANTQRGAQRIWLLLNRVPTSSYHGDDDMDRLFELHRHKAELVEVEIRDVR